MKIFKITISPDSIYDYDNYIVMAYDEQEAKKKVLEHIRQEYTSEDYPNSAYIQRCIKEIDKCDAKEYGVDEVLCIGQSYD